MKNIHFVIALIFALALGLAVSSSHPVQGSAGYTSAPGDSFCSQCHNPNASINGTVTVSGLPSELVPGQTYSLTITLTNTVGSGVRGGFQLLVLNNNNTNSGAFSNNSANTSIKVVSGGRTYLGHEPAQNFPGSGILTWEVDWTAPMTNTTSQAKFYVSGLIANGNNGSSGDRPVSSNVFVPYQAGNPDPINLTITNVINPSCFDSQDGSATVNITGGTPPYSILWNNGETAATALSLPSGTAVVTVTDAAATSSSRSTSIVAPPPITLTVTTTDVSCFGENDGVAMASATGGTGNKTFSWSNGGNGPTQNNLIAGNYMVTATDANGCEETESFTIESPPQILINIISINNPSCFGSQNGAIEVEAEGGSGGFNYAWSNGGSGPSIINLAAGNYLVTVTDSNNCTSSSSYTLTQPSPLVVAFPSINHVTCFGASNGAVTAQGSGGNGNFTYAWSNGGSGASIFNLTAGNYTVTVVDLEGCTASNSVAITQPLPTTITLIDLDPASCSGANDGRIIVEASGSFTNYQFLWSNGANTAANLNIPAGNYTVTVTDPNSCTKTANYTVGTNAPFSLAVSNTENVSCFGLSDGSVQVVVTPPGTYTYTWSNGATGSQLLNLPTGTYTCTASDASGCESSPVSVTITQPTDITSTFTILENIPCYGDNEGEIMVAAAGGEGTFSYIWSNGSTGDTISGIPAGNYVVTITDGDQCTAVEAVFLAQPDSMGILLVAMDTLACFGDEDGLLAISIFGGSGNKSIVWSNGDTTLVIDQLGAGTYSVNIEDENDCNVAATYTITQPEPIVIEAEITPVSPNIGNDGSIMVEVFGGTGSLQIAWSNGETGNVIDSLVVGEYTVTVTDGNNCQMIESYTVSAVNCQLGAEIETTDVTCFGGNDGTLTYEVLLAYGNYEVLLLLDSMEVEAPFDNLIAGVYELEIVDSLLCRVVIDSIVINQGLPIVVESTVKHPTPGQANGSIEADAKGGAGGFSYAWFNNTGQMIGQDKTIENLRQGTYLLLVTDSSGCVKNQEYLLQDMVSTTEFSDLVKLQIYPNPSNGFFTLQVNDMVFWSEVVLRNSIGLVLRNIPVYNTTARCEINEVDLVNGLIIVEVKFGSKSVFSKVNIQK